MCLPSSELLNVPSEKSFAENSKTIQTSPLNEDALENAFLKIQNDYMRFAGPEHEHNVETHRNHMKVSLL